MRSDQSFTGAFDFQQCDVVRLRRFSYRAGRDRILHSHQSRGLTKAGVPEMVPSVLIISREALSLVELEFLALRCGKDV